MDLFLEHCARPYVTGVVKYIKKKHIKKAFEENPYHGAECLMDHYEDAVGYIFKRSVKEHGIDKKLADDFCTKIHTAMCEGICVNWRGDDANTVKMADLRPCNRVRATQFKTIDELAGWVKWVVANFV